MKACRGCDALKAISDYYARDNTCKECRKAAVRANYRKNRDHYREYDRQRANLPHRVAARERYAATDQGRERSNRAKRAYLTRNPLRNKAHIALGNAVRDGKVWKAPCCMAPDCYSQQGLHGHHTHYDNPLSVVWLCTPCHSLLHREFDRKHTHQQRQ